MTQILPHVSSGPVPLQFDRLLAAKHRHRALIDAYHEQYCGSRPDHTPLRLASRMLQLKSVKEDVPSVNTTSISMHYRVKDSCLIVIHTCGRTHAPYDVWQVQYAGHTTFFGQGVGQTSTPDSKDALHALARDVGLCSRNDLLMLFGYLAAPFGAVPPDLGQHFPWLLGHTT